MLQNVGVIAFTVSELFRENQQGLQLPPPPPPRLGLISIQAVPERRNVGDYKLLTKVH